MFRASGEGRCTVHPSKGAFDQFDKEWGAIARARRYAPTLGVLHFQAATNPATASRRIRVWLERCVAVESFVLEANRYPTEAAADPAERLLGTWLRYQRRARHTLSDYQRGRLELLPAWSWNPRSDTWHDQLHDYEDFVRQNGRAPRRGSADRRESTLAVWMMNQRTNSRRGTQSSYREALLAQLDNRISLLTARHR